MIHQIIFYGSFLAFPFLALIIGLFQQKKISRTFFCIFLILSLVFIYGRFIERYLVFVHQHELTIEEAANDAPVEIKIAVFADHHLGVYKGAWFLEKVVEKVNAQNPDLVLIPGDFVYHVDPEDLAASQAALGKIQAPAYGVLGNHDQYTPFYHTSGEFELEVIYEALTPHITMIDNEFEEIEIKGKNITLAGIGSLWAQNSKTEILADIKDQNLIVMMHNPDSAMDFPHYDIDLAVAAHTHGGQIRVPFIYRNFIPTENPFNEGWYEIEGMDLFVTAGTGETGFPIRFLIPPRIDIINLTID